jgi:uncharacterized membrane protein YvbJ
VRCPQCGATNQANLNYCRECGFDYSQFVAQQVIDKFGGKAEEDEAGHGKGLSSFVTLALVILSIIIVMYVLRQL